MARATSVTPRNPIITEEEHLALTDGTGVHSLEDLVGRCDGEEPWIRHKVFSFNADGTRTMMCGLTKPPGTTTPPPKWCWCHICKRYS